MYDLAIIGGGLAGLSLAIQAARAGHRVVLIEKEQYPFHKVCGEYISNESRPFLERLGVPLGDWQLPHIDQLEVSDCAGKAYQFPLSLGGFGVSRYKLDEALYQLAVGAGATVNTGCKVNDVQFSEDTFSLDTSMGQLSAQLVVCSYGKRANLDIKKQRSFSTEKKSRLNNYVGVKYHIRYPQPINRISLHNFPGGYCGISQIEEDTCCLCYLTTAANLGKAGNSIESMEKQILSLNPHLKNIFQTARILYETPLTISQISFSKKSQVEDHLLFMGDAAGLITPLCGNGMSMAMHSAQLLFELTTCFFKGQLTRTEMEAQYVKQWNEKFGRRLATGRLIQGYFGNPTATAVFLKIMHAFPSAARYLIAQTHGCPF